MTIFSLITGNSILSTTEQTTQRIYEEILLFLWELKYTPYLFDRKCVTEMNADPAIGDDLEKPQYAYFFIKLPVTIDYKQNTICLICAPAKRFKRKVRLSQLQKEKENTTWVEMWSFLIYADISLNSITSLSCSITPELRFCLRYFERFNTSAY